MNGPIYSPPRKAVFTQKFLSNRLWIIYTMIALLAVLLVCAVVHYRFKSRIVNQGIVIPAVVTNLETVTGKNLTYYLSYRAEYKGHTIMHRDSVSEAEYNSVYITEPIKLTIDPGDPRHTERGALSKRDLDDVGLNWALAIVIICGVGVLIFAAYDHSGKEQKQILETWEYADAGFKSVTVRRTKVTTYTVTLAIPWNGQEIEAVVTNAPEREYAVGQTIPVFFDPKNSQKVRMAETIVLAAIAQSG